MKHRYGIRYAYGRDVLNTNGGRADEIIISEEPITEANVLEGCIADVDRVTQRAAIYHARATICQVWPCLDCGYVPAALTNKVTAKERE